jgi:hypothetical protein
VFSLSSADGIDFPLPLWSTAGAGRYHRIKGSGQVRRTGVAWRETSTHGARSCRLEDQSTTGPIQTSLLQVHPSRIRTTWVCQRLVKRELAVAHGSGARELTWRKMTGCEHDHRQSARKLGLDSISKSYIRFRPCFQTARSCCGTPGRKTQVERRGDRR